MWWGYSEALDIQKEIKEFKSEQKQEDSSTEVNVLLIGSGDGRHILKTLSKSYEHPKKRVNFYVIEPTHELYARQMILLTTALEPPDELGLLEKSRLFMEIYGNTLVRSNTFNYISKKASQLIDVVTTIDNIIPIIKLDKLKYNERDRLENILKFWKKPSDFYISQLWDSRLRTSLGVRYDSRIGVFDWDYHMRLHGFGGERINKTEYKEWRKNGVAFTWLETEYSKGNPTLVSGILKVQDKVIHHGYFGDVTMGPYATYGLDCEDKNMLKKSQDMYLKRSTDITERNVMRMMYEIQEKKKYVHKSSNYDEENLGVVITEVQDPIEEVDNTAKEIVQKSEPVRWLDVDSVEVNFLPVNCLKDKTKMLSKYNGFFDVLFVAQHYSDKSIDEDLITMGKDGALLLVEGKKFNVGLRQEDLEEFGKKLDEQVKTLKCDGLVKFNPVKDSIARYVVHK